MKDTKGKKLHFNKVGIIFFFSILKKWSPVTEHGFRNAFAQGSSKKKCPKIMDEVKPRQTVTRGESCPFQYRHVDSPLHIFDSYGYLLPHARKIDADLSKSC